VTEWTILHILEVHSLKMLASLNPVPVPTWPFLGIGFEFQMSFWCLHPKQEIFLAPEDTQEMKNLTRNEE
jgi:hypothetical protein